MNLKSRLHQRIHGLGYLEEEMAAALDELLVSRWDMPAEGRLVSEGDAQPYTYFVHTGWGIRYKQLSDGSRQILNFVLPGDVLCLFAHLFPRADYSAIAIEPMVVGRLPSAEMPDVFQRLPRLAYVLAWIGGQDERILAEQIVRVGRRRATARMAHLFVELHTHLCRAGFASAAALRFPVTQPMLADALGMSHIHAHRTFKELSRQGLANRRDGHVELCDLSGLVSLAGFDTDYLDGGP